MRKFIAILLVMVFGAGYYFYYDYNHTPTVKNVGEYEKIMSVDLVENYPNSLGEVMILNNKIIEYLYGDQDNSEVFYASITPVIEQYYNLWDENFKILNSLEGLTALLSEDVKKFNEKKVYIIGSKMLPAESGDPSQITGAEAFEKVKVVFYTNNGDNIYYEYGLVKKDSKWMILGWHSVENFIVTEVNHESK